MLGKGYENLSLEIEAPRTVTERRDGKLIEVDRPAFVKIYTNFKAEMKNIDSDALKVWLFIALSVNRFSGEAHPGLRAISDGVGLAVNTVRAAIERLDTEYNLLTVEKEGGKSNKYYPTDYVSANRDTVSPRDTPPQTVSNSELTVSKNIRTVSTQYRKSAQPEEPDFKPEGEKRPPSFKNMSIPQARKVPTLRMYYEATGWMPADVLWEQVHETITKHNLTAERIRAAAIAWVGKGYKRGNVMGILEWAINGAPVERNAQSPAPVEIDKFASLKEMLARQEARS